MKLQVNNSGAWKQVFVFSVADVERVKIAGADLVECAFRADELTKLRILDGRDRVVLYCDSAHGWHVPHFAKGYAWQV